MCLRICRDRNATRTRHFTAPDAAWKAMSDFHPMNELDQAIVKLRKSQAALPEFMRALGEGELWALVPWHPEVEDEEMELKNGDALPFSQLDDKEGPAVPLFSSHERVEEAMERAKIPPRTYLGAAMPARMLLEILGKTNLRAVVNKSCETGEVTIGPDLMRDVADGSAFEPAGSGPTEDQSVEILDAADYPTGLVQAVFEVMRPHGCFRAAWIFGRTKFEPEPEGGRGYKMMVLMEPWDDALFHEFNLVANSVKGKGNELDLGRVPENDGDYTAQLFRAVRPFYIAADYPVPPGAKE